MPQAARDLVLLLARLVLGAVLVAHGLQKVAVGAPGTAEGFGQLGIPQPGAAAVFTMVAETGGGLLLLLGALTPLAALLPAVVMAGALPLHVGRGVFVTDGGWELAATVGAGLLVIAVVGPGRVSVDGLVSRARRRRAAVATASTPGSTGG
ncbi:DoxX family protein [Citricoccus sp. SGAir0253]|nr:DoxX family protein [Citricoccus sp. SGAir0253]